MSRNPHNRLTGALLLGLFLLSGSGILPSFLGFLAKLDGSHRVAIQQSGGSVTLILTHEPESGARHSSHCLHHTHGTLAGLVTSFQSGSSAESDHRIQLSRSSLTTVTQQEEIKPVTTEFAAPIFLSSLDANFARPDAPRDSEPTFPSLPSLLRSTVLLI